MAAADGDPTRQFSMSTFLAIIVIALAGCATRFQDVQRRPGSAGALEQRVSAALLKGKPAAARETLAAALRAQPRNGGLHLLNGLSYQIEDSSSQSLALAKVGYDAAVKFAPGHFWPHYLAGSAAFDLRDYAAAAEHFSSAIMDDPDRSEAFLGLAISAYFTGDLGLAQVASGRALALAPKDPLALRTTAYVLAARGERGGLDALLRNAEKVPVAARELDIHKARLARLLRMATVAQGKDSSGGEGNPVEDQTESGMAPEIPATSAVGLMDGAQQVMIEVTILLNQSTISHNNGINLLDGLTGQFGVGETVAKSRLTGTPDSTSRVFTSAIRVPDITYSLNLFNTKQDFYRVVARPSLVAYLGEQSEFFIGRTVTVGVSGVNLGTLEPVDVGVSVKITPSELTPDHAKFKVSIIRSFPAQDAGGTFAQSLTTFKQTVEATAEVDFGKTLILSGLYEGVDVGTSSKMPLIGDIPVLNTFFNARTRTERRDVALVLVTPSLPGSVETGAREFRGETLNRLLSIWKDIIDPQTNMDAIIGAIGNRDRKSNLFQPKTGDLRLPPVADPVMLKSVIKDTMAQMELEQAFNGM